MPTEKRARQKAARQAKLDAERKRDRNRTLLRRGAIIAGVAVVVAGSAYLITRSSGNTAKASTASTTTTAKGAATTTTAKGATTTTSTPTTPTTTATNASATTQAGANAIAVAAHCPASTKARVNHLTWSSAPAMTIDPSKTYVATVKTTAGTFDITLDPSTAPKTVNNFVFLAEQGFYHCVIFHRVIPGFMDQTGDPTGTGGGGPGYTIPDENPTAAANPAQQYPAGSVAMANTGQPNSGGSQWFIVTGSQGESLPPSYALFGHVTSGFDVAQKINAQGNANPQANGVPPDVTHRILSVTISSS
ncbi:MAG TPA: peptidylprolyl isomerase [Acidimicrobiales bacterium]|nr:peptidylprolyl isomerase [Acidimicrobiales bacterium]